MAHSNSSGLRPGCQSVFFLAFFACSISSASLFDFLRETRCTESFRGVSYIHGTITKRKEGTIIHALSQFDESAKASALSSTVFRSYNPTDIKEGRRSLLSLGEGESDFIAKVLTTRQFHSLRIDDIHAVDAAYHGVISEVDPDFAHKSPLGFRAAQVKNFPGNYHGQRFDALNVMDKNGSRILFDEIISGNSLSYVLKASNAAMKVQILKQIALHAKKQGILRFWNIKTRSGLLSEEINQTLKTLKESQVIKDFIYLPNFEVFTQSQEGWYVIFP